MEQPMDTCSNNSMKRKHENDGSEKDPKKEKLNELDEMKQLFEETFNELMKHNSFADGPEEYVAKAPVDSRIFFSEFYPKSKFSIEKKLLWILRNLRRNYPVPHPEQGQETSFSLVAGAVCLYVQNEFLTSKKLNIENLKICLNSFGLEFFHWQNLIVHGCLIDSLRDVLIETVSPFIVKEMKTFCTDNANFGRHYFGSFASKMVDLNQLDFLTKFLRATTHLTPLQNFRHMILPDYVEEAIAKIPFF